MLTGLVVTAPACLALETGGPEIRTSGNPVSSGVQPNPELEDLLKPLLTKHSLPGLVAGIVRGEELAVAAAVGVRKSGAPDPMTVNDLLHLGSNTKAMTATRLAMLVDQGQLAWSTTLAETFADFRDSIHPDFRPVTIQQLLQHRAGLAANVRYQDFQEGSVTRQRDALARHILSKPPVHPPGTKFEYSNLGYIIAGHMAEQVTGRSWEELMTRDLFEPLEMKSAGFGPPGKKGAVDQPWGHTLTFGVLRQPLQHDNLPVLGPAGTVHASLADWSRFVALHLQGARGRGELLKPESFQFLQTPPAGGEYAGGWLIFERPWAKGRVLYHNGSNTMWYAVAWIAPEIDRAYLVVVNQGGAAAQRACDDAVTRMIGWEAGQRGGSQ